MCPCFSKDTNCGIEKQKNWMDNPMHSHLPREKVKSFLYSLIKTTKTLLQRAWDLLLKKSGRVMSPPQPRFKYISEKWGSSNRQDLWSDIEEPKGKHYFSLHQLLFTDGFKHWKAARWFKNKPTNQKTSHKLVPLSQTL